MNEFQINQNFIMGMSGQAVFMFAMLFLLWMMFRANTLAHERGSNLIQKILGTAISGSVLLCNFTCPKSSFKDSSFDALYEWRIDGKIISGWSMLASTFTN